MTEVLNPPPPSPPSSSSSSSSQTHNNPLFEEQEEEIKEGDKKDSFQLNIFTILVTLFRKTFWVPTCKAGTEEFCGMDIGCPTNVRHVAHVTFDRFNGFLGLPLEFEPEVLNRAPSASATVFGVSTESMQLSYDHRGNSVPTILLLMQHHLYAQGGLQAEGIFRITAGNSQEEYARNQLNRGMVPEGIDVHSLAGLIKAWFRELPTGVLDPLSADQVMQSQTEEECAALVRLLPPTETALLEWAVNLMADVVQQEHVNKMNSRNIAMVFAPNMTHMKDPLTALMYAVQVMNFLKMLISKTLREREDNVIETAPISHLEPSDENGHQDPSHPYINNHVSVEECEIRDEYFVAEEPELESLSSSRSDSIVDEEYLNYLASEVEFDEVGSSSETEASVKYSPNNSKVVGLQIVVQEMEPVDKRMGISTLSRINSRIEWIEGWR